MSEPVDRFSSQDPEDIQWRVEQANVSAEIEGIKGNPALDAYVAQMDADGVDIEEQIRRIAAFDLNADPT